MINLLSIYIIKNQRLTHKVVVNAESLLYVIIFNYNCFINMIYTFLLLRFVFVCAVVRITNQTNKHVTH